MTPSKSLIAPPLRTVVLLLFAFLHHSNHLYSQSGTSTPPFDKTSFGKYELDLQSFGGGSNPVIDELPAPGATGAYPGIPAQYKFDGSEPDHNFNAIYGPNGKLLFFIHDRGIYGNNGLLLNTPSLGFNEKHSLFVGASEVIVFPLNEKENCTKYGVISGESSGASKSHPLHARLIILDLEKTNSFYSSLNQEIRGRVVQKVDLLLEGFINWAPVSNTLKYDPFSKVVNSLHMELSPNWFGSGKDKHRKLYLATSEYVFQYRLNAHKLLNPGSVGPADPLYDDLHTEDGFPTPFINGNMIAERAYWDACATTVSFSDRAEMELVEKPNGDLLMARPGRLYLGDGSAPLPDNNLYPVVKLYKIDGNTGFFKDEMGPYDNICPAKRKVIYPDLVVPEDDIGSSGKLFISGLEFFDEGKRLFATFSDGQGGSNINTLYEADLTSLSNNQCINLFPNLNPPPSGYTTPGSVSYQPRCTEFQASVDLSGGFPYPIEFSHIEAFDLSGYSNPQFLIPHPAGFYRVDPATGNHFAHTTGNTPSLTTAGGDLSKLNEGTYSYQLSEFVEYEDYFGSMSATAECCATNSIGNDLVSYTVSSDASWDPSGNPFSNYQSSNPSTVRIRDQLVIEAGVEVDVSDMTFLMGENAEIILERGAELNAENCVFDAVGCDGVMWHGFQVWGNVSEKQTNLNQQAKLVLDESEVRNARNAVMLHRSDAPNIFWDHTGGIVQAENTKFIDNKRSAEFLAYPDDPAKLDGPDKSDYFSDSYFHECEFVTQGYLKKHGQGMRPGAHITMWSIEGVGIQGCEFRNDASGFFNVKERGLGIKSIDARYAVKAHCPFPSPSFCEEEDLIRSRFEGLLVGVEASAISFDRSVKVEFAEFENNIGGIYLMGVDFADILYNDFSIPSPPAPSYQTYGTEFRECTGYGYEANSFQGPGTFGTIIVNYEEHDPWYNKVYRNDYEQLLVAQQFLGENAGYDPGTSNPEVYIEDKGLKFKCNDFDDILVDNYSGGTPDIQGRGVSTRIGENIIDDTAHAGNRFDGCFFNEGELRIAFSNGQGYEYFHQVDAVTTPNSGCYTTGNPPVNPQPVNTNWNTSDFNEHTDCPVNASPPWISIGWDDILSQLRTEIGKASETIEKLQGRLDKGDAAVLYQGIKDDDPAGQVKNILLDASPYLSDEVLLAAIRDKDTPLPPGVLKQVILANSPLSDTVMSALENRTPSLPKGIEKQIDQAQTGINEREEAKRRISYNKTKRGNAYNHMMRTFIHHDSIPGRRDSMRRILEEGEIGHEKCRRAQLEDRAGNHQEARALLDSVQASSSHHDEFCEMQRKLIELHEQGLTCRAIEQDSAEMDELKDRATDTTRHGCTVARSILDLIQDERIPEEYYLPQNLPNSKSMASKEEGKKKGKEEASIEEEESFRAYPNPASERVTVELPSSEGDGRLLLRDMTGRTVKELRVNGERQRKELGVRHLKKGLYYIEYHDGTDERFGQKLMIAR